MTDTKEYSNFIDTPNFADFYIPYLTLNGKMLLSDNVAEKRSSWHPLIGSSPLKRVALVGLDIGDVGWQLQLSARCCHILNPLSSQNNSTKTVPNYYIVVPWQSFLSINSLTNKILDSRIYSIDMKSTQFELNTQYYPNTHIFKCE